ncbi:hypothetical protein [Streptomyces sp. F-1]|uniref:hypothetical protein n=1 Tax=Streptomyces sp. F-1 TaxID=463642 RepID=UPI00086F8B61|nr:hypothetical protein [Streptomyces sp. F-1]SFY46983.1 hypothetical protein STEPF1_00188 [Streptomyces sp. F-1]
MNHGPDDRNTEGLAPAADDVQGPRDSFGEGEGSGGPDGGPQAGEPAPALGGPGSDEAALRMLLHSAVDGIEPSTGSLEHLRRAVPARRARKRQAAVGMAAAALFFGTAIPALVHVSGSGGSDPDTAMAGQSSQAKSGTGHGRDKGGGTSGGKGADGRPAQPGKEPGKPGEKGKAGGAGAGSAAGADPSATLAAGVPVCTAAQLGSATGSTDAPDSAGVVYGTFHVTNVSASACTVDGAGTVGASAQGAAEPAKIIVVRHAAGDAATGLPDPSQEVSGLVLQPGSAYEERFAFVPSETCPTSGGSTGGPAGGGASPDPTPTATDGSTDTGGPSGATTQLGSGDTPPNGNVLLTHTPQAGSPTASTVVTGECAGTVYYTGLLAGS